MQTNIKRPVMGFALLALCLSLFSFTDRKGGDSFAIYLNNKLVLEQFLHQDKDVKSLVLTDANYNDKLTIKYSHCGLPGKGRSIALKDAMGFVVKVWVFENASGSNTTMSCNVKEIMDLQKTKGNVTLRLCYTSSELPNGHVLLSITKGNAAVASR